MGCGRHDIGDGEGGGGDDDDSGDGGGDDDDDDDSDEVFSDLWELASCETQPAR